MADQPEKPKLKADKELEQKAEKAGAYPVHPLITRIAHKLGAFNIIRNAANERTVDVNDVERPGS